MKFQNPLLLLAALVSYTSAKEAEISRPTHPRDLIRENHEPILAARGEDSGNLYKRAPPIPSNADPRKLYVFVRREPISKYVDNSKGLDHSGYNELMTRICAQHVDLVIGNQGNWYEIGLAIRREEREWLKDAPNAENEKVVGYADKYKEVPGEQWVSRGALPSGWTIEDVRKTARAEAKGKTFTVQDRKPDGFNCNSFANHMLGVFGV